VSRSAAQLATELARRSGSPSGKRKPRRRSVPLQPEVRHFKTTGLEIREKSNTNELIISGSPIVYNTPYRVVDMFGEFQERMAPGVASAALARGADVRFLVNHEGLALARSTSGTMTFTDTPTALTFEARLDARQQMANDLAIAVER
jgi:phage head maturation protease